MAVSMLALLLSVYVGAVRAAVCPATGENAPQVTTLMASKSNPTTDAWVVKPDCTVAISPLENTGTLFTTSTDSSVERVESLPSDTTRFFSAAPLSRGADLTRASKLVAVSVSQPAGLLLPSSLLDLALTGKTLASLAGVALPDALQVFSVSSPELRSLKDVKFPSGLKTLDVADAKLTGIDFAIPPKLTKLILSGTGSSIPQLDRLAIPSTLQFFRCNGCGVKSVRGIKWPSSMEELDFGTSTMIENFEIRRSDLAMFKAINPSNFQGTTIQPKCADSTAEIAVVAGKRLCVVSDERFEQIYVNGNGITPNSPADSASTPSSSLTPGSASNSVSPSIGSDSTTGSREAQPSLSGSGGTADGTTGAPTSGDAADRGVSSSFGESSDASAQSLPGKSPGPGSPRTTQPALSATDAANGSSSTRIILVLGIGGGVLVIVLAVCIGCIFARRRRVQRFASEDKYDQADSPSLSVTRERTEDIYLANDVRNDKALIPFRIEQRNLLIGQLVAQSTTSVVYKSSFQGRDVVVKQLRPVMQHNKSSMARFMDEIRSYSRLDHHKIVVFVGIAWSSLRDLSIVLEFMPGGSLKKLLDDQHESSVAEDWFQLWTSTHIKAKASIAQDVAEAVVYLHSFSKPILHRNLKTRNVLLDEDGTAKLSGFGISRELAEGDPMTGEVGTAAWTAPEVLRGERYDEKADVYSLGVLMVELDRCQHPYASEALLGLDISAQGHQVTHSISNKNMQIAVLVSSGKLRPSVSSHCPKLVASLVAQCLSFYSVDRPTSLEVCYRLRQARKVMQPPAWCTKIEVEA